MQKEPVRPEPAVRKKVVTDKWGYWSILSLIESRVAIHWHFVCWRRDDRHDAMSIFGNTESENAIFRAIQLVAECSRMMNVWSAWRDLAH